MQTHLDIVPIIVYVCAGMNGLDYINIYSAETFTSGSMNGATRCVDTIILDDNALEGNQNFTLTLTTVDSSVILGTAVTAIKIVDNDSQCWASLFLRLAMHQLTYYRCNSVCPIYD